MRAVHRCGLLSVTCLCLSVCVSFCLCRAHGQAVQKSAEVIKMALGADSCGSSEPCIRCWSRSNESNVDHEAMWQDGNVAFCQTTLDTCSDYHHLYVDNIKYVLIHKPNISGKNQTFCKLQNLKLCIVIGIISFKEIKCKEEIVWCSLMYCICCWDTCWLCMQRRKWQW